MTKFAVQTGSKGKENQESSYICDGCDNDSSLHWSCQLDIDFVEKYSNNRRYRQLFTPRTTLKSISDSESLLPVAALHDFELGKCLQKGEVNNVYVARARMDHKMVVIIKSIRGTREFHEQSTCIEIKMLMNLIDSKNVIDIYDYFSDTPEPCTMVPSCRSYQESKEKKQFRPRCVHSVYTMYMVMECAIEGDIYQRLGDKYLDYRGDGFPPSQARDILRDIVSGLQDCHKLHYVHHDIKLENIVQINGIYKIIDFGLAKKIMDPESSQIIAGTLEFLAPEIITRKAHDHRSDIWTLGILLYEMITGVTPFNDDTKDKIMINIKSSKYRFPKYKTNPRETENRTTEPLKDLINKILQPDPYDRISLEEILQHPWMNQTVRRNLAAWRTSG